MVQASIHSRKAVDIGIAGEILSDQLEEFVWECQERHDSNNDDIFSIQLRRSQTGDRWYEGWKER